MNRWSCRTPSKRIVAAFLLLLLAAIDGFADDDICFHCGMKKSQYGHSWVVIEYEGGRKAQTCSIHCAAIEMVLSQDDLIESITVGDYDTHRPIDAYRAFWVIGGDLPGVMTLRAKWAFGSKAAAGAFIDAHGGRFAVFEEVIRAAFADLYEDTIALKRKRKIRELEKSGQVNGKQK